MEPSRPEIVREPRKPVSEPARVGQYGRTGYSLGLRRGLGFTGCGLGGCGGGGFGRGSLGPGLPSGLQCPSFGFGEGGLPGFALFGSIAAHDGGCCGKGRGFSLGRSPGADFSVALLGSPAGST